MSAELKPCPFCGSDALSIKPNIHTGLLRVQCEACWAVTATSVSSNNRQTAIAAWNRRASPTTEGEGGERARFEAQKLLDAFPNGCWLNGSINAFIVARALLSSPVDARREALEEAAKVAEMVASYQSPSAEYACLNIAKAIRALKETKP